MKWAFLILIWSLPSFAFRPFILHSGQNKIYLVQYKEPQGCNCTQAEEWFKKLKSDKGLWKKFVPLWVTDDHLDLLNVKPEAPATPAPTPVAEAAEPVVDASPLATATPTAEGVPFFTFDGNHWNWDANARMPLENKKAGELYVARAKYQDFEVTFTPKDKVKGVQVVGVFLAHRDKGVFQPLESQTKELKKNGGSFAGHLKFSLKKDPTALSYSAIFWVTEEGSSLPLQAVGADIKPD